MEAERLRYPVFFNQVGSFSGVSSFSTIQTDAGTNPVADSAFDTLTLTSSDSSVTITGNSTTDTVDFSVGMSKTAYLKDIKANNTKGGTPTAGSYATRDLNTSEGDTSIINSLTSNQFSLLAGTYLIHIVAPGYSMGRNKIRLQNITDVSTEFIGVNAIFNSSGAHNVNTFAAGRVVIAGTKTFEVQHRAAAALSTNGFGDAMAHGDDEIYTIVTITQIA